MAANCPHCQASIESLPGFVPQATLEERINKINATHNEATNLYKTQLKAARERADGLAATAATADDFRQKYEAIVRKQERSTAVASVGLPDELLEHVEILYNAAAAGLPEPPEFGEWLKSAVTDHPLLTPYAQAGAAGAAQGAAGAAQGAAGAAQGAAGASGNATPLQRTSRPNTGAGAAAGPAPASVEQVERQLRAILDNTSLSPQDKDTKIAELEAKYAAGQ